MIFTLRHLYEKELAYLRNLVSQGMVVVDAGANCGIYTVAAARLVGPSGRVLSFEPGLEAYSILKKNIEINHFRNVRAYRVALCDQDGQARLYHDKQGPVSFTLGSPKDTHAKYEDITTRNLTSVLREEGVSQVGLIKLDVEGAEELVLRGVESVLVRSRPKIILEMNAGAAERLNLNPSGAWDLLKECGYRFFFLQDSGVLSEVIAPPPRNCVTNLIAVHNEDRL